MVKYTDGQLLIGLPTQCPDELHQQLMQSIVNVFKQQSLSHEPLHEADKEANYWMLELLSSMIEPPQPTEQPHTIAV